MKKITATDPVSKSADLVADNVRKLAALLPEAVRDGSVDLEVVRELLGSRVDDKDEKFGLNWRGKRQSRQLALTPSNGTLLPFPVESVAWDTTKNLFVEGDNLEVLKLLQKSYAGKVKLIYIDPPYNTGGDFIYPDDFRNNIRNYLELTGQVDSAGRTLSSSTETSGRYHTDWLNMMYPRVKVAKNLLTQDGIMMVSIDETEVPHLQLLMDEILGEENRVGTIVWKGATDNNPTRIAIEHEYIVCYAKSKEHAAPVWKNTSDGAKTTLLTEYKRLVSSGVRDANELQSLLRRFIKDNREALQGLTHYDRVDIHGVFTGSRKVHNPKPGGYVYDVKHPVTKKVCVCPVNGYRYPPATMKELIAADRILWGDDHTQIIQIKEYLHDYEGKLSSVVSLDSRAGANELQDLFGVQKLFSNPKPVPLLSDIFEFIVTERDIVLDFFAGSGSTGHALWKLNAAAGLSASFILVQLPQPLDPEDKDERVGATFCDSMGKPRTIAELTKERLRRSGAAFSTEHEGDWGFRVYKLAESNLIEWAAPAAAHDMPGLLERASTRIVPGRSEEDLLTEIALKLGLDVTSPVQVRKVSGKQLRALGNGVLFACLAKKFTAADVQPIATAIAQWHDQLSPATESMVVFRDDAFPDDITKANMTAILAQHGLPNVRSL